MTIVPFVGVKASDGIRYSEAQIDEAIEKVLNHYYEPDVMSIFLLRHVAPHHPKALEALITLLSKRVYTDEVRIHVAHALRYFPFHAKVVTALVFLTRSSIVSEELKAQAWKTQDTIIDPYVFNDNGSYSLFLDHIGHLIGYFGEMGGYVRLMFIFKENVCSVMDRHQKMIDDSRTMLFDAIDGNSNLNKDQKKEFKKMIHGMELELHKAVADYFENQWP